MNELSFIFRPIYQVTAIGDASQHGTDGNYPTTNPIQMASYEVINIPVQTTGLVPEFFSSYDDDFFKIVILRKLNFSTLPYRFKAVLS